MSEPKRPGSSESEQEQQHTGNHGTAPRDEGGPVGGTRAGAENVELAKK